MSKNIRRRVPAANVGAAPQTAATAAPVQAPMPVQAPTPVQVPTVNDDGVPSSITQMLANVNANQPRIEDLLKRIDLGNYVEGLEASELLGCTWQSLADLRPRFLNAPTTHATELVLRQAIDRADPNTSPLVCEEISAAIKLAVAASDVEVWKEAQGYSKDIPARYPSDHKRHIKPADARKTLDDKLVELNGANDLSSQLKQARIAQAIDAIDDVDKLVKIQKSLNSMRSKGTGRRAVFTMLAVCKDVIEANSEPKERGGNYVRWALQAKSAYEKNMQKWLSDKEPTVITADKVQAAVTEALTSVMRQEKGEELGEKAQELTAEKRIDKLWDLIASCEKKVETTDPVTQEVKTFHDTAKQLRDVLRANKYLRSDATEEAELPVTESTTGRTRKDDGKTGTVNPPVVETAQPIAQPVQRTVPAAALSLEEAAAKLNA